MTTQFMRSTTAAVLILLAASACTEVPPATQEEFAAAVTARAELARASGGQSTAVEFFQGPDGMLGLIGYNRSADEYFVAWASPNGKALIIGPVLVDGANITAKYQEDVLGSKGDPAIRQGAAQLRGQPSAVARAEGQGPRVISSEDMQRVASAAKVSLGTAGGGELYVFYDPYCSFCRQAETMLEPYIEDALLRVHYLPVRVLGERSAAVGAAILGADEPAAAFNLEPEVLAQRPIEEASYAAVEGNTALLKSLTGRAATPTFVFSQRGQDRAIVVEGMPGDIKALVADVAPPKT